MTDPNVLFNGVINGRNTNLINDFSSNIMICNALEPKEY